MTSNRHPYPVGTEVRCRLKPSDCRTDILWRRPGDGRRPRRMTCNYCRTHVTPQWRCGPDGPRTLCNACGVRWGKGKLEIRETTAVDVHA